MYAILDFRWTFLPAAKARLVNLVVRQGQILLLGFSAFLLLPNLAHADSHAIPATMCQVSSNDAQFAEFIKYGVNGRILNDHSSRRIAVICPVPRHYLSAVFDSIRVFYSDGFLGAGANNVGELRCRLRANTAYGDTAFTSQVASTLQIGSGDGVWWFHGNQFNVNDSYEYPANYTMQCALPPRFNGTHSFIGSIVIED